MKLVSRAQSSRSFLPILCILEIVFLFSGCSAKKADASSENESGLPVLQNDTHHWYSFNRDSFEEVPLPRLAQKPTVKPWTEATRISSAAATDDMAFFTANRRGIIMADKKGNITLKTDARFFPDETAGSLFLDEGNPVFHIYRNNVFFKNGSVHEVAMPFLAEYNLTTDLFYPVLYRDDFGMSDTQEVSSIVVEADKLYLTIKDSGKKTAFDYYRVIIPSTYTDTGSTAHVRTIDGVPISQDEFQKASNPNPFSEAPERLKTLLSAIPASVRFSITCQKTGNSNTPRTYLHGFTAESIDSIVTDAYAMMADSWTAALFPDGTMYFQGSLPGMYMVKDGKTVCFSMPDLPKGYIWTYFAISGSTLTAAWEQSGIFKTGAAGFITVNLEKVLY